MESLSIIEYLNVLKDCLMSLVAGLETTMVQQFTLERSKKTFYGALS